VGADGNLFLVGMMGAGKTTVGRIVARRLKRKFLDSDHEIERHCGVRVAVIFDVEGEVGFRKREADVIAALAAADGIVLATGGGAVLCEETRKLFAARGTVVYLHASPEALYARVRHDRNRPLLSTADPLGRLRELYAQRDPLYRSMADIVVESGVCSVQELAKRLAETIEMRDPRRPVG
jgi:shikimate kinase